MKLRILSDLHLEHDPGWKFESCGEDAVLLAGDLGSCRVRPITERFIAGIPVPTYFVLGNHDFYHGEVGEVISYYENLGRRFGHFHFLHNRSVSLGKYLLAGTPLWTDFALYGDDMVSASMANARRSINDFNHYVRTREQTERDSGAWLEPSMLVEWNREARKFLQETIAKARPMIVMSHWCPSVDTINPLYAGDPLNPYFATECRDLMGGCVELWIHGHSRLADDRMINGSRVLRNPKGYPHESSHRNEKLVIEI